LGAWTFPGPNPITQYVLGLELRAPISQETLKAVASSHRLFRHDLPRATQQQAVTLQMGVGASPNFTAGVGGVTFDRISPDGTIFAGLTLLPNQVTYTVGRYRRWREHWPVAERILGTLFQLLPSDIVVNAFILHSVNKFSCDEDDAIDVSNLISADDGLVSRNLIRCRDLAHSFHGFQVPQTDPPGSRIDNINVTLTGGGKSFEAEVTFNLRLLPSVAPALASVIDNSLDGCMLGYEQVFRRLHERNNVLFKQVIVRSAWCSIPGLEGV
jgi:uncharacterized protein (TIGR04255 family)